MLCCCAHTHSARGHLRCSAQRSTPSPSRTCVRQRWPTRCVGACASAWGAQGQAAGPQARARARTASECWPSVAPGCKSAVPPRTPPCRAAAARLRRPLRPCMPAVGQACTCEHTRGRARSAWRASASARVVRVEAGRERVHAWRHGQVGGAGQQQSRGADLRRRERVSDREQVGTGSAGGREAVVEVHGSSSAFIVRLGKEAAAKECRLNSISHRRALICPKATNATAKPPAQCVAPAAQRGPRHTVVRGDNLSEVHLRCACHR